MPNAFLSGWFYVPLEGLSFDDMSRIKRTLTFVPKKSEYEEPVEPIRLYDLSVKDFIGLPVDWGLNNFGDRFPDFEDCTTEGIQDFSPVKFPDPNHERASPNQGQFMDDLLLGASEDYAVSAIAPTGTGKCLHPDQGVLMWDGTVKSAKDIIVGDLLMGDDSTARKVLSTVRGKENMYRIVPNKGESWICNESHILSLKRTQTKKIVDIALRDYLLQSKTFKNLYKQYRAPVKYFGGECKPLPYDPYIVGAYLGDGSKHATCIWLGDKKKRVAQYITSYFEGLGYSIRKETSKGCVGYHIKSPTDCTRNFFGVFKNKQLFNKEGYKVIPHAYKVGVTYTDRAALLAGILDTDGSVSANGCVDIIQKSEQLAKDIVFVARSLGLAAYLKLCKKCIKKSGFVGEYYRISISGDLSQIPFRRLNVGNRLINKDCLVTGFKVEPLGQGDYCGFEIDGNRRFLLDDFTVTHNTVTALNAAGKLGHKTLVIVHLERLAMQWAEEAHTHLGIPKNRIGIIRGDKCDYKNKDILIGITKSISSREYSPEFYRAFGTVIWDEVHRVGAPSFSKTLGLFNAKYKISLTATPTRKDGCEGVFKTYFGNGQVVAKAKALACQVQVYDYMGSKFLWGNQHGSRVTALTKDTARNRAITDIVKKAYDKNRNILVVSERIEHLQTLIIMAEKVGIPSKVIGQFTGEYYTGKTRNKTVKGRVVSVPEKKKISSEYLDWVKSDAQVIFATYTMMKEGIDIPRLDYGIDVTPRTDATQLVGRIRRPYKGKPKPIWVTIRDVCSNVFMAYYNKRLNDYKSSHTEVAKYE